MPVPPHVGVVFFSPLGVSTPHTHRCTVYIIKTMRWDQKRDRYEEGNKKNTQGLEALPACDTDSHIFQVLSHQCLRTSLEVHAGIIPGVQVGTRTCLERHKDSSRMENR